MAKYHIDPAGNPGLCRATKRCPFGDLTQDHYESEPMARKAYEIENTMRLLSLDDATKNILDEVGPRQLPNRAWATLRRAIEDDRFTMHSLDTANAALSEEWEKLNKIV